MTQLLAYQIGGVFFLAVLLIAGTMTRGLFPSGLFKNVTLTLGVVTVLVGGYAAYRTLPALPEVSSWFHWDSTPAETQETSQQETTQRVVPQKQLKRALVQPPAVQQSGIKIREVEVLPATPSAAPHAEVAAGPAEAGVKDATAAPIIVRPPEPQEGKVKKGVKSVGRFLHLVPKKDVPKKDEPKKDDGQTGAPQD